MMSLQGTTPLRIIGMEIDDFESINLFFVSEQTFGSIKVPFFGAIIIGILFCLCCCISRTIFSKAVGCSNPDKTSDMIDPAATSVHHNGQDSHSQRRIINSHTQQHHESSWRRVNDSTGRPFWFDEITGESRWTDPHHCNSKAGTLPIDWEAIFDSKSRKEYFYNAKTGESRWSVPGADLGMFSSPSNRIQGSPSRRARV